MSAGRCVSRQTLRVLAELLKDPRQRRYGLELAKSTGLPSGSLYPILARLKADKWIDGQWEKIDESKEGRRRRCYYLLTRLGAHEAKRELRGLEWILVLEVLSGQW